MWFGCVGDKASQEKELEKTSCKTANSETATTSETTTPETKTSETRSKPLLPTPGMSTQSQSGNSRSQFEKTSDQVQIAEIYKQFPDANPSKLHHYLLCTQKQCTDISSKEHNRIKVERNKEKFHHSCLETNQYLSVSKLQCSGRCILKEKGFIAFCVKSTRQQIVVIYVVFNPRYCLPLPSSILMRCLPPY